MPPEEGGDARIDSIERLRALYSAPSEPALAKERSALTPEYRRLIEASPFVVLASSGPDGLDCSPRGDPHSVVHIEDDRTLLLPDRRGNNRLDTLANVLTDPRVALLFLIPGSGTTLRVRGTAEIRADAELLARFTIEGRPPRTVLVVRIESVFFQCARAILRSGLWDPARPAAPADLPSAGEMLQWASDGRIDGAAYDRNWPDRARRSLW